jgi:hypothetical protein
MLFCTNPPRPSSRRCFGAGHVLYTIKVTGLMVGPIHVCVYVAGEEGDWEKP